MGPAEMRARRRPARHGRRWPRPGFPSLLLLAASAAPLSAQEDFRSLDLERPTKLEDAFPLKYREWEVEVGARGAAADSGSGILGRAEFKSGLFLNGEAGIEVAAGFQDAGDTAGGAATDGTTTSGIESVAAHLLYNLRHQTWRGPAVALRLDVMTPGTGSLGRGGWAGGLKGMVTRSFGHLRAHANGGYVVAADADAGDYVQLGLALDHPLGLFSKLLIGDVYLEIPTQAGRARVWAELGSRWQIGNRSVLDFGLATRLDEWGVGNANLELTLGLSRVFGIPGLVRVPNYPSPSIR